MARRGKGRGKGGGDNSITKKKASVNLNTSDTVEEKSSSKLEISTLLEDKPGKLTREEVTCPICWSILLQPTTLPCKHSLCEGCFRKHVEETSLCCPCCRLRVSVWCRKAMKDKKLVNEKLWIRIRAEFPRLVEARLNGEDSQDLNDVQSNEFPLSSTSLADKSRDFPRDGTMCEEAGVIRSEFDKMMEQHHKELEQERLREETASASLIKQLEEEENQREVLNRSCVEQDYLLAKKLQDEFRSETQPASGSATVSKTPCRNLMKEWIGSSPPDQFSNSPPVGNKSSFDSKKSSQSVKSKRSSVTTKGKNVKRKISTTSSGASKASQELMSKFLSSPQNELHLTERILTLNDALLPVTEEQPCSSTGIPNRDISFSAFSPTKPSAKLIASTSLSLGISPVQAVSVYAPEILTARLLKTVEDTPSSTKTPDSINSEVDRHFRPIRSAPKTPPKRRQDGTFLPEPKLVRTTPIRPSTSLAMYALTSPLKERSDNNRPSCATIEKRVSNDSGRASIVSRSPDDESGSSSSSCKDNGTLSGSDRNCTSDDYRITPENDDCGNAVVQSKKRTADDDTNPSSGKKAKAQGATEEASPKRINNGLPSSSNVEHVIVKQEPVSPGKLTLGNPCCGSPIQIDVLCSQESVKIEHEDTNRIEQEAKALEIYRLKVEQEAADRAFAEALQKSLNQGISTPRGRNSTERYSLRSWLKPQVKKEPKTEIVSPLRE